MQHWAIIPFVLPALTACVLVLLGSHLKAQRAVSLVSGAALMAVACVLLMQSSEDSVTTYALGDWPVHIGIVFVVDRLSAIFVMLTAIVGLAAIWHASHGWDTRGRYFHALLHFQLMGLNGAFLTGDVFNLFVCFEVMLIASYCLLQHGSGATRLKAGTQYVVLNLIGSSLFLIAVSLIYRVAGTLNMADLGVVLSNAPPEFAPWVKSGALLLLVVFLLKAAAAPMYLWLPGTYGAAAAPVAAIFSVLTKVGAYAVLRVYTVVFGDSVASEWVSAVVLPAALASLIAASFGAFAATTLTQLSAWLALGSTALFLVTVGLFGPAAYGSGLFYLIASTLAIPVLFFLTDVMSDARGRFRDDLCRAPRMFNAGRIAVLFFLGAIAVAGLPPLAGFLGKMLVLQGANDSPWVWTIVLASSLLNIVALARAGSRLFWAATDDACDGDHNAGRWTHVAPAGALLIAIVSLTVFAGGAEHYVRAAGTQIADRGGYLNEVLKDSDRRMGPRSASRSSLEQKP